MSKHHTKSTFFYFTKIKKKKTIITKVSVNETKLQAIVRAQLRKSVKCTLGNDNVIIHAIPQLSLTLTFFTYQAQGSEFCQSMKWWRIVSNIYLNIYSVVTFEFVLYILYRTKSPHNPAWSLTSTTAPVTTMYINNFKWGTKIHCNKKYPEYFCSQISLQIIAIRYNIQITRFSLQIKDKDTCTCINMCTAKYNHMDILKNIQNKIMN